MVLGGCLLNNMGLSQLGNALALLRVKFLVIVKSHTFNLGKIRVRDLQGGGDGVEIELKNVASYVLEGLGGEGGGEGGEMALNRTGNVLGIGKMKLEGGGIGSGSGIVSGGDIFDFDCVLVSGDFKVIDPKANPSQNLFTQHRKIVEKSKIVLQGVIQNFVGGRGGGRGIQIGVLLCGLDF